jgi:ABC-type Fe3+-siderophore transport system permease subunit
VSVGLLTLVALASIAIGAKELSLAEVWHGLFEETGTYGDVVVGERISRTLLGLLAGAALGLAGAVLGTRWPTRGCSASTRAPPPPSSPPSPTSASPR